ncbi:Abortive infection protein [halophilic archaeon DL31]|nr:Abortive infection protein [halophilic archaeon DL31]
MPDWTAFGAVSGILTVLVLLLARSTQSALEAPRQSSDAVDEAGVTNPAGATQLDAMSSGFLLLNVFVTQGLFLLLLLTAVWYTELPLESLGVELPTTETVAVGTGLGVTLFGLNRLGGRLGRQFGLGGDETLRSALAPERLTEWLALLLVVLPSVAVFEELLFRGALVGGLAAGFGLSPGLLVAGSSLAFGLGHGVQGWTGIVVTALLSVVLGVAFVVTGSLTVVVVAHYLVNALEFIVCEGVRGGSGERGNELAP